MSAGFTPGPWSVGAPTGHNPDKVFRGDDAIASVYGVPVHQHLNDLPKWGETYSEGVANARLIAAAPDLYAALRSYLAEADAGHVTVETDSAARAALAKAQGEVS